MTTRTKKRSTVAWWLSPGQQFRVEDPSSESVMTVARIVDDPFGLTRAILRDSDGREISTYADQIQFAIEAGMMSPLETGTTGLGLAC
ncbi:MAG TPA: hypothetical protein VKZ61_03345 [Thermomicrobiales bacterium]|jgi:hypothetical protein|nr:hypothetical protein [Thermomicrobiales bacterium]